MTASEDILINTIKQAEDHQSSVLNDPNSM